MYMNFSERKKKIIELIKEYEPEEAAEQIWLKVINPILVEYDDQILAKEAKIEELEEELQDLEEELDNE